MESTSSPVAPPLAGDREPSPETGVPAPEPRCRRTARGLGDRASWSRFLEVGLREPGDRTPRWVCARRKRVGAVSRPPARVDAGRCARCFETGAIGEPLWSPREPRRVTVRSDSGVRPLDGEAPRALPLAGLAPSSRLAGLRLRILAFDTRPATSSGPVLEARRAEVRRGEPLAAAAISLPRRVGEGSPAPGTCTRSPLTSFICGRAPSCVAPASGSRGVVHMDSCCSRSK